MSFHFENQRRMRGIAVLPGEEGGLYVIADDGTVWFREWGYDEWTQVGKPVPESYADIASRQK